ncbi:hypothetical protein LI82_07760 [Methanococcoides methylutens]|uniref:PAS domain-containing protein n=1 Tax=Methanococcoides methylutens TaxID=2226 RepID=A0A099T0E7_METMT|nr:hypothetical protein LI82_07760 [Methanococcoides methylutens]
MDSIISGVVIIDSKDHVIVDANETAANMIGLPKEEIIGNVCHKYICPAEASQCPVAHPGQILDRSECVVLNYKGEPIPILKTVKKFEKGDDLYFIESFIDISNLKDAEKDLLVKEKAIDSSINAIFLADPEGNLTYVNPSFLELWGYDDEKEILGRTPVELW